MKNIIPVVLVCALLTTLFSIRTKGQSSPAIKPSAQRYEYASVRFMGKNTSFVWPDGTVEKLLTLRPGLKRPSEADDRMFHLTVAMNVAAEKGFELIAIPGGSNIGGVVSDDIVFRREVMR